MARYHSCPGPRLACKAEFDTGTTMIDIQAGVWLKASETPPPGNKYAILWGGHSWLAAGKIACLTAKEYVSAFCICTCIPPRTV